MTVTRAQVATFLKIDADPDGSITAKLAREKFDEVVAPVLEGVEKPAKDAPITIDERNASHPQAGPFRTTRAKADAMTTIAAPMTYQPSVTSMPSHATLPCDAERSFAIATASKP